jgi:hypothetical protein
VPEHGHFPIRNNEYRPFFNKGQAYGPENTVADKDKLCHASGSVLFASAKAHKLS